MILASAPPSTPPLVVRAPEQPDGWDEYLRSRGPEGFLLRPVWLHILRSALGHRPHFLEARRGDGLVGVLPLAFVRSVLFGRRLVSLPYLNSGGLLADSEDAARLLIDRAVSLAEELDARHLELRHEREIAHPALGETLATKVHLRLALPATVDELWNGFRSKLRSQVKKPLANAALTIHWGRRELLREFYRVFCRNMRDLGTPPYPVRLFAAILERLPNEAELCVVRHEGRAVSGALLVHGPEITQVPSASTVREANAVAANMLLYWRLLERAVLRGQNAFDFGRSTIGAGTYHFKKQWGAEDHPAVWQYCVRHGAIGELRPESGRYARLIRLWKRLPVPVTRWLGPPIVRGIP